MRIPGPQWFVDPYNSAQWRWWDGVQWTGHCAPREMTPANQARAQEPGERTSFVNRDKTVFQPEKATLTVVFVAFRQLGRSDALDSFTRAGAYAYVWHLTEQPQIGQWVMVPGYDGLQPAVVGAIGTPADAQGITLKAVSSLVSQSELNKAAAERGEPLDDGEWLNITGVGDYQKVLAGRLPRHVQVELFPWDRGTSVTARVDGRRVGELPPGVADRLHPVLHARREAGMPPVMVLGQARRGNYVAVYLAVNIPNRDKFTGWISSIAPEGFTQPRPKEERASLHALNKYQDALALLFEKYGSRTRGVEASITWTTTPSGKYAGHPMGLVCLDGTTFAELNAAHPDNWQAIYDDHQAGMPGRLLVNFWQDKGKYGTFAAYRTPQPPNGQP